MGIRSLDARGNLEFFSRDEEAKMRWPIGTGGCDAEFSQKGMMESTQKAIAHLDIMR